MEAVLESAPVEVTGAPPEPVVNAKPVAARPADAKAADAKPADANPPVVKSSDGPVDASGEGSTEEPATVPPAEPASETYSFADMQMKVGDRAQLEPPAQTGVGRTPVKIVGWLDGQGLIVTLPKSGNRRLTLREGEVVLLRVFTGRRAFAFKNTVLKTVFLPFEHLHLSFPDHVEGLEVRNSHRCRVDMPARFTPAGAGEALDGRIANISTSGALLDAAEPLGATGTQVSVDFDLELHGVPASLSLLATIRSVKMGESATGKQSHQHGVVFKDVEPNDRLILGALVWYELHENPGSAA